MDSSNVFSSINDALKDSPPTTIIAGTLGVVAVTYLTGLFLSDPADFKRRLFRTGFKALRSLPGAQGKIDQSVNEALDKMAKTITIQDDANRIVAMPEEGWTVERVLTVMRELKQLEEAKWRGGKVSGVVYGGDDEHTAMMNEALQMFSLTNPLHPDVFVAIRKFEAEITAMTASLVSGGDPEVCAAVTSGGTESILMACKAHRDYYRIKRPQIVVPEILVAESAHAAFDKACHYFGMKMVKVPVASDHRADVAAMRAAITPNTIMLVGSAPSYPHGLIDPISELSDLAQEFGIGLHVDCCLGGFFLPFQRELGYDIPPFDFSLPGVTSMSADTHKYGYAVKGTSVVLFRNKELRKQMYFVITEWSGGIYASPTIAGSRPGTLIAACWASLVHMGRSGYLEAVRKITETQRLIKAGIPSIDGLQLVGDSQTMIVSFQSSELDVFSVSDAMHKRGWHLNCLQKPNSVHLCVTAPHIGKGQEFLDDLRASVAEVRASGGNISGGSARIYGLAYGLPDRSIIGDIATGYLDVCLKP